MRILPGIAALCLAWAAEAGTVSGSAAYRERIALPPDAVLQVELRDISRQDVAAPLLSARRYAMTPVPMEFSLEYDDALIDPAMRYAVSARILQDERLLFVTDTVVPVLTGEAGHTVDLLLVRVSDAASALVGRDWALREIEGIAVEGPGAPSIAFEHGGRFSGQGGCNRFQGQAEIGATNMRFPDNIGMTMMACSQEAEALDRRYLAALAKVVAYAVEGDALTLAGVDGRVVLRFVTAR
ncbi:YbaY family lipoprotein [Ruegeria pomeroyi]|uniref:YbaY family lipoprotein n=1 Tax=Ruegeria pomeroyi TaxID=89184 RepID=UPI001F3B084B|nr:YbaY family lipoprotein [Ruegeria pomeroyi]MCE8509533.1 YbaY family lipoprotein [Ruegeria pomeroyi]